jgi:predicted Zn finger-like uncharacterized protein
MIIACPSCQTRFQVEEAALRRLGGRLVRCANCGHGWRHSLETAAPLRAEPEPPPIADRPELPAPETDREPVLAPPSPMRSGWAVPAAVVLALALVVAALATGIVERRAIVARYPAAAGFYARIGLPVDVEQPSAVLKIDHIKPVRTADGLLIEGEVSNSGKAAHELPSLRVALEDAAQNEVQSKVIPPPKERLEPGEVARFTTPIEHPALAAKDVVVTFASR